MSCTYSVASDVLTEEDFVSIFKIHVHKFDKFKLLNRSLRDAISLSKFLKLRYFLHNCDWYNLHLLIYYVEWEHFLNYQNTENVQDHKQQSTIHNPQSTKPKKCLPFKRNWENYLYWIWAGFSNQQPTKQK